MKRNDVIQVSLPVGEERIQFFAHFLSTTGSDVVARRWWPTEGVFAGAAAYAREDVVGVVPAAKVPASLRSALAEHLRGEERIHTLAGGAGGKAACGCGVCP